MVHPVEKNLKEHGDKLSPEDKGEAEAAVAATRTAMEGSDTEALRQASERLSPGGDENRRACLQGRSSRRARRRVARGTAAGDNVVDAEFEELDESKKKSA